MYIIVYICCAHIVNISRGSRLWHPVSHWVFKLRKWSFRKYMACHVATMGSEWVRTRNVFIDTHVSNDENTVGWQMWKFNPLTAHCSGKHFTVWKKYAHGFPIVFFTNDDHECMAIAPWPLFCVNHGCWHVFTTIANPSWFAVWNIILYISEHDIQSSPSNFSVGACIIMYPCVYVRLHT